MHKGVDLVGEGSLIDWSTPSGLLLDKKHLVKRLISVVLTKLELGIKYFILFCMILLPLPNSFPQLPIRSTISSTTLPPDGPFCRDRLVAYLKNL